MNFKRKKSRRQVRCTMCTSHRWHGNDKERFKASETQELHRDPEADFQDEREGLRKHKSRKKLYVLEYKLSAEAALKPYVSRWCPKEWTKFRSYATEKARDEALYAFRHTGTHYYKRYEFRARSEQVESERLAS